LDPKTKPNIGRELAEPNTDPAQQYKSYIFPSLIACRFTCNNSCLRDIGTEKETEKYIFEKQIIGTGLRGLKDRKIASY